MNTKMNTSFLHDLLNGISNGSTYPTRKSSKRYLPNSSGKYCKSITKSKKGKLNSVLTKMADTVKGKLRLGARILQVGGVEKVFTQLFSIKDEEKLLKASQCYLSTTSGPITGLLFISTHKVAFRGEKSIKITSPKGELIRVHYKVSIPHEKIEHVNQSQNVRKPSKKYVEIVTVDGFDFWFMGFFNYRKALKYLQQAAISQSQTEKM
ncbi:putative GEM-like protein 8 [Vicia villosa]|uniref:putative GEM-like protein 8 n=1 Tax=Vicia villosa TaxID=3911 RepID=UPI00273B07FB|nr:putative GEM-like protein 8 [Vicia villosa]XP_058772062.1 putative GEM-like protein 8 [Vicia villosa]XP_058772063.1 putative GEM-like protein 8 [Vicia villosa]XP_058772064.1 putative GEM-like protein 8 [Vicia villosa]